MIGPPVTHGHCGPRHLSFTLYPSKPTDLWGKGLSPQFLLPSLSSPYLPEKADNQILLYKLNPNTFQSRPSWSGLGSRFPG